MGEPSKVIHVRNVAQDVTEHDLHMLAQEFGAVQKVVHVRAKNQALLQMQDLASAVAMIQYYSGVQPLVRNQKVYVQFSSHQELTSPEPSTPRRQSDQEQANRILLVTIHNPLYPINVDVLQQVFSPYGFVEKIVTFQKSAGLQALLQYPTQQQATQARNNLQGRNIYDGCCTLDIQYSNLQELQVNYNNDRTRDFTNNQLPEGGGRASTNNVMQGSLFGDGGNVYGMHPGQRPGFQQPPSGMGMPMYQQRWRRNGYGQPYGGGEGAMNPTAAAAAASYGGALPEGITGTNERCTLLISNLDVEHVDPDKLFNLFSNYGNIVRIKMLHNKPDHAFLQMADPFQAELAVHYLRGVGLFEKAMEVNYSKHSSITPSPETREYGSSNLNRFTRNAVKNYRHCCSPTRMIHCSSLPADITPEALTEHLAPHGTILGVKVYDKDAKKQALVLFSSPEEATEALVCKHTSSLHGSNIRLAFSKMTSVQ